MVGAHDADDVTLHCDVTHGGQVCLALQAFLTRMVGGVQFLEDIEELITSIFPPVPPVRAFWQKCFTNNFSTEIFDAH